MFFPLHDWSSWCNVFSRNDYSNVDFYCNFHHAYYVSINLKYNAINLLYQKCLCICNIECFYHIICDLWIRTDTIRELNDDKINNDLK